MIRSLRFTILLGLVAPLAVVSLAALQAQTPQARPAAAPQATVAQAVVPPAQPAAAAPPPPINQSDDPLLKTFRWRNIGPASMGGRIDDFAVVESNPSIYYVGFATGGIFKTINNGTTFTPIFDTYPVSSIGDIAVAPSDPNILYVGTGEANNRQSSSFGAGIYKSTDAGKTFTYVGLKETQSIARIVVHPANPNIVYVAVIGHLFGPNKERGLYKTIDGGKTWNNTQFIDEDTGFTDVVMDPKNPELLFAASYQRRRTPHGFNGGGPGSGLWKTTNGGKTWTKLSGNGLPEGIIGRIGLDICRTKPNVIVAQFEVGASGGTGAGVTADGKQQVPGQGRGGGAPGGEGAAAVAAGGEAAAGGRAGAAAAGGRGTGGGRQAGAAGTPPAPLDSKRTGVWRSEDGGKTWKVVSNTTDRPMYYSQVRIDPNNDQVIFMGGAPAFKSIDGGKTFRQIQNLAHSDHHAIWVDPKNSSHVMYGNDGGLDVSYDGGDTWDFIATMAVGQFYAVSADMRKPYVVCGGLQDNGSWCGPSAKRANVGILNSDWFRVGGGDGFYTQQDPTDWATVYSESQDGNVNRLDLRAGRSISIRPRPAGGGGRGGASAEASAEASASNVVPAPPAGDAFRFFWNTPTALSPHNPFTVWLGGNRLFKSLNRGESYTMTEDLTRKLSRFDRAIMGVKGDAPMASKHDGVATTSVITTVAESPAMPGVVWVGTNDGNLQVSRDGGLSWKNVVANVKGAPDETHIARVEPSHFDAGTCYVVLDAHRTDDHTPYVYVTKDYGQTFTSVAASLPAGNANVIREDPKNRNLLYLGTEYALYVSVNGGKEWKRFMTGLPTVRIDDLLVHPRDNDLIVGTHGRSIWIVDDISPLQQLTEAVLGADAFLFPPRPGVLWRTDTQESINAGGNKFFRGENPQPGTAISYYLKTAATGDVKITISDYAGKVVREIAGTKDAGLNRVQWNLRGNPPAAGAGGGGRGGGGGGRGGFGGGGAAIEPGAYLVKLTVGGKDYSAKVVIEADEQ
ncbi:MAG: hypothetical protein NTV05_06605 [Acidobacteria bacterium]|nr:hypothetical protein [Acidobacteriota bacterium]